jgi:serine/threonine protein kinase
LPFGGGSDDELVSNISKANYHFDAEEWEEYSCEIQDLIKGLLRIDPNERFSADDILNHPWLINNIEILERMLNKLQY